MPPASSVILIIFVTGAMASDIQRGRIFNFWLVPAFLAGAAMRLYASYMHAYMHACRTGSFIPDCVRAVAVTFAVFLLAAIPYFFGGLGAGDVKLVTAGSVFMSFHENIVCLSQAFLLAGVLALFMLVDRAAGAFARRIRSSRDDSGSSRGRVRAVPRYKGTIPFAVPYALSVILMTGGVTDICWHRI